MKNYIVINGKKAELTEEQLEKLGVKIKEDFFERKFSDFYYCIKSNGKVCIEIDEETDNNSYHYEVANYCRDKALMERRALREILNRLLWRFSMRNGGDVIDWTDSIQNKFFVVYDYCLRKFDITSDNIHKGICPYFISPGAAQRAIDEIIKPFAEKYQNFIW